MWGTKRFNATFGFKPADIGGEHGQRFKTLFLNQGFYNLVLAIGLFWGLFHPNQIFGKEVQTFFTAAVASCGIVGGVTAKPKIFFVQALPALLALASLYVPF